MRRYGPLTNVQREAVFAARKANNEKPCDCSFCSEQRMIYAMSLQSSLPQVPAQNAPSTFALQ